MKRLKWTSSCPSHQALPPTRLEPQLPKKQRAPLQRRPCCPNLGSLWALVLPCWAGGGQVWAAWARCSQCHAPLAAKAQLLSLWCLIWLRQSNSHPQEMEMMEATSCCAADSCSCLQR